MVDREGADARRDPAPARVGRLQLEDTRALLEVELRAGAGSELPHESVGEVAQDVARHAEARAAHVHAVLRHAGPVAVAQAGRAVVGEAVLPEEATDVGVEAHHGLHRQDVRPEVHDGPPAAHGEDGRRLGRGRLGGGTGGAAGERGGKAEG